MLCSPIWSSRSRLSEVAAVAIERTELSGNWDVGSAAAIGIRPGLQGQNDSPTPTKDREARRKGSGADEVLEESSLREADPHQVDKIA
jgi:hypothetical protein